MESKTFDFKDYFTNLDQTEQEAFASAAGTTIKNIVVHFLAPISRRRTPHKKTISKMVEAANGSFSKEELLAYFYATEEEEKVA